MQVEKKGLTTAKLTKDYLSNNEIPQLFECLMTGLMYHRPSDHITYLEECLQSIRKHGVNGLRWDMFLESRKTSLPPIESTPREDYRPQPLPQIGDYKLLMPHDASVIVVIAGPGVNKKSICKRLCASFPNYIDIEVGSLLRDRALLEAQDNESSWKTVKDSIDRGELAPEDFVTETVISELNKHSDKKHLIIEGYPRTNKQREAFERFIGFNRLKFMLLIDCEEEVCRQNLSERDPLDGWNDHSKEIIDYRICNYQAHTLVVIKYFDEQHKLRVIDGDRQQTLVMKDVHELFVKELNEPIVPHPPTSPREPLLLPRREVTEIVQLTGVAPEEKRNPEFSRFKLVVLLGGPGSGKTEVATRVCSQHQSWFHVDANELLRTKTMDTDDASMITSEDNLVNVGELKDLLRSVPDDTEVVILEGFPTNADQLRQYNIVIGKPDSVILLDSEEDVMYARMSKRYFTTENVKQNERNNDVFMSYFKMNGLPVCRYYDERCALSIVSADGPLLDVVSNFEKMVVEKLKTISNNNVTTENVEMESRESMAIYDDENAHAAATKIQASVRGHLSRKRLKNRQQLSTENTNINTQTEADDANSNHDNEVNEDQNKEDAEKMDTDIEINEDENDAEKVTNDTEINEDEHESMNNENDNIEKDGEVNEDENKGNDGSILIGGDVEETENNGDGMNDENVEEISEVENKEENVVPIEDTADVVEEVIKEEHQFPLGDKGIRTNSQLELNSANVILLLGGPWSGKKTLGSFLVSKFAISFVHADQIINNAIEEGSEDVEIFRKYLANEECDETPIYALIRRSLFNHLNVSKVLCLAGFPRTAEQYQRFNYDVCQISATILLEVDEDILKSRLSDLDQESEFVEQMEVFKKNSPALIEALFDSDHFSKVDASQDMDHVTQNVCDIIENLTFMKNEQ